MNRLAEGPVIIDIGLPQKTGLFPALENTGDTVLGIITHGTEACLQMESSNVYPGCPGPLVRGLYQRQNDEKRNVRKGNHPAFTQKESCEHGVSFLIRACHESNEKLTIVATDVLTNIAVALRIAPNIAGNIREVLILDEKKYPAPDCLRLDPEAAQIVLDHHIPVSIILWNGRCPDQIPSQIVREAAPGRAANVCLDRGSAAGILVFDEKGEQLRLWDLAEATAF